jgi:Uma2 family endonuclease
VILQIRLSFNLAGVLDLPGKEEADMTVLMDRPSATDEHWNPEPEELLDSLELPPGYKAELIERDIVVTPPPSGDHEGYFAEVTHHFNINGWRVSGNTGLAVPLGNFIPDLTVARKEYFRAPAPSDGWRSPEGVALVAEITSSNPSNDRDSKRRGYAQAEIPLYLLIDRKAKETVLFSHPEKGDYVAAARRRITDPIALPAPFSFTLEDIR